MQLRHRKRNIERDRALKRQIKQKKWLKVSHGTLHQKIGSTDLPWQQQHCLSYFMLSQRTKKSHFITPWKMSWNRNCQKISAISYQNHTLVIMDFQCRWWKSHGHDDNERRTNHHDISSHFIWTVDNSLSFFAQLWTTHERCAHSIIFALLFQPEKLVDDFESSRKFEVKEMRIERGRRKEEGEKMVTIFQKSEKSHV